MTTISEQSRLRTQEIRTPEVISDEVMASTLASINTLPKAILPTLMDYGRVYNIEELEDLLKGAQGGAPVWGISSNSLLSTCSRTLVSAKALQVLPDSKGNYRNFRLTQHGYQFVVPAAGHMLNLALTFPYDIDATLGHSSAPRGEIKDVPFGETDSIEHQKRAPFTRKSIISILENSDGYVSARFVANQLRISPSQALEHLTSLQLAGVIDLKDKDQDTYGYAHIPGTTFVPRVAQKNGKDTMPKKVSDFFANNPGIFGRTNLAKRLIEADPSLLEGATEISIIQMCTKAIRQLVEGGFLKREKFGVFDQIVVLDDAQSKFISKLNDVLKSIQKKDPAALDEGRRKAEEIVNDPQLVVQLMDKAQKTSRGALPYTTEQLDERITAFLSNNKDAPIASIREELSKKGLVLSKTTVRRHITRLQRTGKVDVKLDRKTLLCSLISQA